MRWTVLSPPSIQGATRQMLSRSPQRCFRFYFICRLIISSVLTWKHSRMWSWLHLNHLFFMTLSANLTNLSTALEKVHSHRYSWSLLSINSISHYISINGKAISPISAYRRKDRFPIFLLAIECLPARTTPLSICSRSPIRCGHHWHNHRPYLCCTLLFSYFGRSRLSEG